MPVIKYENVDIHIDSKIILEDVNFTLKAGDFAYITGAVGSGKSTFLKSIYGEVDINSGKAILFDEFMLKGLRRSKLPALRKRMGIVFQDFQLLIDRTVHDNLEFVLKCTGWKNKTEREKRIQEVLDLVGLPQKGYKMPHELSGGEQQRIVIARAILNHPSLLLADEPTGNLDNETGNNIMKLLHRICEEEKTAVLMITHNEQWLTAYPGIEFQCKDKKIIELNRTTEKTDNANDCNNANGSDNNTNDCNNTNGSDNNTNDCNNTNDSDNNTNDCNSTNGSDNNATPEEQQ